MFSAKCWSAWGREAEKLVTGEAERDRISAPNNEGKGIASLEHVVLFAVTVAVPATDDI